MRAITGIHNMSPGTLRVRSFLIVRNVRGEVVETFPVFDMAKIKAKYEADTRPVEIVDVRIINSDRLERTLARYNWNEVEGSKATLNRRKREKERKERKAA